MLELLTFALLSRMENQQVRMCLISIFEVSLSTLTLPSEWKLALCFRFIRKDLLTNYCKLLTHIVLHHLNLVLDKFLCNRQHGCHGDTIMWHISRHC